VSRVHRTVDWRPDCGPWWTTATGGGRNSPERKLTGVPVCGRASVKGSSDGASLMRRCSRREGEERRAASAVWRGGDGAPFIGVGRLWWGGEMVGQAAVVRYQEEASYGRGAEGIDAE
jgi:hypothetical protein